MKTIEGIIKASSGSAPHSLTKRIDAKIAQWQGLYLAYLIGRQSRLTGIVAERNENFASFGYLSGRVPVTRQWRATLERSFRLQLEQLRLIKHLLVEDKDLLAIYDATFSQIFDDAVSFRLPYLSVERILTGVFADAAMESGEILDLFKSQKDATREAVLKFVAAARWDTFDLVVLGNHLGISGNPDYQGALSAGRLEAYLSGIFARQLNYFQNDASLAHEFLKSGRKKIVYVMDNAGESVIDLFYIAGLVGLGHQVWVVTRARPVLNDETADGLADFFAAHPDYRLKIEIMTISDAPGLDLTDLTDVQAKTFSGADLIILKGEGNLMGMPPENKFRQNILHIFIAKNPLFFVGLGRFMAKDRDPIAGEAVVWFRPAVIVNP